VTNVERVLSALRAEPGLSDGELRERTQVNPHQRVNQICRRLEREGYLRRIDRPDDRIGDYVIENGRSSSSGVARDRYDRDARYAAALASPARRQETDMHQADLDVVACSPRSDASSSGWLKRIRPGAEHGAVVSSPFGSEFPGRLLCVTSRVYASTGPRNFRSSTVTTRVKFFAEAEIRRHNVTNAYK